MKQIFLILIAFAIAICANAQEQKQASTGDLYEGLTRKITFDRMIPPYGLEVSFNKTVHVIFPSAVRYVDLGSADIIAGKADGSENVIRVKAAIAGFEKETNFSVITDEGSFYTFNVKYADEPVKLNVEMKDFIHDGQAVNRPNNSLEIYLKELGNQSPKVVHLIMKSIYESNKREIKHIGSKRFGIQYLLKGIYTCNGFLYFHIQTKNSSQVPFDIDFIRLKIVDKKIAKRTAIQETVIFPVRSYHHDIQIPGKKTERTVFALDKFTIEDGKELTVELFEKNGGRHQCFVVQNEDITRARVIDDLKVK
jgi:conjugative transposon TraN protein